MEVECEFFFEMFFTNSTYWCKISKKKIAEDTELIPTGEHVEEVTNDSVEGVTIFECNITKVPKGLTKIFPNLRFLSIFNSNLKQVRKEDLAEYKHLKVLFFTSNKIEYLPGDLFDNFDSLTAIDFRNNNLKIIEPYIFDGLQELKHIQCRDNQNYDFCASEIFPEPANATLDEVKLQIIEKFPYDLVDIIKIIHTENKNLKKVNEKQVIELEKMNKYYRAASKECDELKEVNKHLKSEVERLKLLAQTLKVEIMEQQRFFTKDIVLLNKARYEEVKKLEEDLDGWVKL